MRKISMAIALMVSLASYAAAQVDPPSRVARLNYREGPVSFQPTGLNEWVDADINRPITTGDNLWVGDRGRAEFHVGSTALRLSAGSAFQFLNLDDQTVQIRLSQGTLNIRLRSLAQDQIFEIDTPNLALTLNRGGDYRIEANPDAQTTVVTVGDGEGQVTGGGQDFPLYSRQRVVASGYDQLNYNLESVVGPDEFDKWCAARNLHEEQSQSARYVSREVPGYDDLDEYGRWSDQPGYGSVWMPTSVDADWAPYRNGHWAWIAPWGWTWVDEAPWGFAPYHYGRWSNFVGRWGWIPGPSGVTPLYAPALVGWVGGGEGRSSFSLSFSIGTAPAVGWFPLGPREPYFPSYRASQRYFTRVNNTNTVINNVTINNYYAYSRNSNNREITNVQYANRNVANGVTAVPQSSFASGRKITRDARPVSAAQLASAPVVTAPSIAPQRESVMGAHADTAARAARPPANVMTRQVVARTAPPPAAVPFERQQAALAQNPGRPVAVSEMQQMRQNAPAAVAPVRVVDMSRVRRMQPPVGRGPDGVLPQNAPPQSPGNERRNDAPGQMRQQQNIPQPQVPVDERQNAPAERMRQQQEQDLQRQQQQDVRRQQQNIPPQPQEVPRQQQREMRRDQQNTPPQPTPMDVPAGRMRQPDNRQRQQQPESQREEQRPQRREQPQEMQRQQRNVPVAPPPAAERQSAPPQQQVARPSAPQPKAPPAERQQQERGRPRPQNENDKKQDK